MLPGVSLGLQTEIPVALSLFIGIMVHGFLLSVAVSFLALTTWLPLEIPKKRIVQYLACLILTRPIGILIGVAVGSTVTLW